MYSPCLSVTLSFPHFQCQLPLLRVHPRDSSVLAYLTVTLLPSLSPPKRLRLHHPNRPESDQVRSRPNPTCLAQRFIAGLCRETTGNPNLAPSASSPPFPLSPSLAKPSLLLPSLGGHQIRLGPQSEVSSSSEVKTGSWNSMESWGVLTPLPWRTLPGWTTR